MLRPLRCRSRRAPLRRRRLRRLPLRADPACAAFVHAVDQRGEHVELLRVGVLGAVVLARVRPEAPRSRPGGPGPTSVLELLGDLEVDHRLVTARARPPSCPAARRSRYQRSTGCSLSSRGRRAAARRRSRSASRASAHSRARERHLAREVDAPVGARGGPLGDEPQPVELDRDVGDHERDRLAVGDRLAERDALLDVGAHVVEHRLRRCRRPARTSRAGRARRSSAVNLRARRRPAARSPAASRPRSITRPVAAARTPIAGLGLDADTRGAATRRGTAPAASVELGGDDEQLGRQRRAGRAP